MLQFLKMTRFILNRSNSLLVRNDQIIQYIKYNFLQHQIRLRSAGIDNIGIEQKKPKKKTPIIPKITLIYPDKSTTVTLLEEAERLAKRRNFNLIKVLDNDPKNDRSVYKLESPGSYKIQDTNGTKDVNTSFKKYKTTKLFTLKSKINEHDLDTKIRNINRALKKMHRVKIIVSNPDDSNLINVMKVVQEKVEGRKDQEKTKNEVNVLVFSPVLNNENTSSNDNIDDSIEPSNEAK